MMTPNMVEHVNSLLYGFFYNYEQHTFELPSLFSFPFEEAPSCKAKMY